MNKKQQGILAVTLFILILVIDQISKIYVKTHFHLHENVEVTSWFYITFIENNGMAYGMQLVPKLALTLFRIICSSIFAWALFSAIRKGVKTGFVATVSMVVAGAFGNIIDCVFYGRIFEPVRPWFEGRVVDMLYFPLFRWPDWVPFLGNQIFFSPVFNFADACISVGVALLIFCYAKTFQRLVG